MSGILVVEPQDEAGRTLEAFVASATAVPVARASTPADALSAAAAGGASVIIFGLGVSTDEALQTSLQISEVAPSVCTVLVREQVSADVLRRALRSGVSDVVSSDSASAELTDAIARCLKSAEKSTPAAAPQQPEAVHRGRITTVFSTKGGVGKTVVATNLGVALAHLGLSVVLVDLDLQFGDVGIMLGLEPTLTISGLVQNYDRLDSELLSGYLIQHSSGLKCLLAPTQPEEAEAITPGRIARILELLGEMFDAVIVDTCASLDETVLTALDRSDRALAVTMMDVASIKNTRISLQKLHQLGYDGSGVEIVLNRADSKVFLQPAQVEKAIGRDIGVRIPSDRIVPQSVNKGVPVVIEYPKSPISKALVSIAHQVMDSEGKAVSGHVS
jgi:pilus assembly protein CpaE